MGRVVLRIDSHSLFVFFLLCKKFPNKLHQMLDAAASECFDHVVSWELQGMAFKVHNIQEFINDVLPIFFKQRKYKSFQRQLNLYGFQRISEGVAKGGYHHKLFIRGQRSLCQFITRHISGYNPKPSVDVGLSSAVALNVAPSVLRQQEKPAAVENAGGGGGSGSGDGDGSTGTNRSNFDLLSVPTHLSEFQFPYKLSEMLDMAERESFEHVVSWQPGGLQGFRVHDVNAFVKHIMPRFFNQTKYKSFQRQLNLYGFTRQDSGPNKGAYRNEFFVKGRKELLSQLTRVKIKGTGHSSAVKKKSPPTSVAESGNEGAAIDFSMPGGPGALLGPMPPRTPTLGLSASGLLLGSPSSALPSYGRPLGVVPFLLQGHDSIAAAAAASAVSRQNLYELGTLSSPLTTQRRSSSMKNVLDSMKKNEKFSQVDKDLGSAADSKMDERDDDTEVPVSADGLSWRQRPSESFSDWTIEVVHPDGPPTQYHVHRRLLAVGPRRSEYFEQFCKTSANNTTQLHLDKAQAGVFPQVLDHMYADVDLIMDAEKAYALYSLADALKIKSISKAAVEYFESRMDISNIAECITVGMQFRDKALLNSAILIAAEKLRSMELEMAAKIDPGVFGIIIAKSKTLPDSFQCGSSRLSQLVTACVSNATRSNLNEDEFRSLTNQDVLPTIESEAAVKLLATANTLLLQTGELGSNGSASLNERCVESIEKDWDNLRAKLEANSELRNAMKSVSSSVLFDLLMKTKTPALCNVNEGEDGSAEQTVAV